MYFVAIRMLTGDRVKFIGIIMGLTFATLLISQQAAIFCGLMSRTYGAIKDCGQPDIWVMDPKVQFIDDIKPLPDTMLGRIRGVEGVAWAVPLYKGMLKARLANGNFQNCIVMGLEDSSLMGGPPEMVQGNLADLRRTDGVIVDEVGARDKLAQILPDGSKSPLQLGSVMELNDRRAVVVGICRVSRTFQSQPVIYTTYKRAMGFAPHERRMLSFVLVKAKQGTGVGPLCRRLEERSGLQVLSSDEFAEKTYGYFMKYTGIPINFGIAIMLGFAVGCAVAGQMFHSFAHDNLRHFAALKAMGATAGTLLRMILAQALMVAFMGYGLGVGLAAGFGMFVTTRTELAFRFPWPLFGFSAAAIALIVTMSACLCLWKVLRAEPAMVFK